MPSGQDSSCNVPVTKAAHIYHSGNFLNIYLFSKQQNSHRWLESLTSTSGGEAVTVGRVVLQVAPVAASPLNHKDIQLVVHLFCY